MSEIAYTQEKRPEYLTFGVKKEKNWLCKKNMKKKYLLFFLIVIKKGDKRNKKKNWLKVKVYSGTTYGKFSFQKSVAGGFVAVSKWIWECYEIIYFDTLY